MARIFITGSADGLGQMAAKMLVNQGHQVVLHARNQKRGEEALKKVPGAENVLTADLSDMEETKQLAEKVNVLGRFDTIIHNAGVYQVSGDLIFAVNTLAPYILTCLIQKPKRLVYLSSGMHLSGDYGLKNMESGRVSYSDSKLHGVILCMATARKWSDVYSNAVDPGWVPTKMGGPGAPGNLQKGFETQVWLAVNNDEEAKVSGCYFYHKKQKYHVPEATNVQVQEQFLNLCKKITGVGFPE
ncbi:SDR family NAD(P)-dependent oxidoreductase [Maribellus comscasis]|uniref:SDR family NAD(P)-dependent oxidoreductase n=1 Tax=Maribellus comscasis TaxID=2681766 RepID=A0A6I6JW05_9BACT|nr:SDR family NAD(P)-dependent oxidoreductase [Maribellus comscasis]QGY45300.1 SDR family NAD(P)-dependent oxidoreductase [Maribellus comscasis]